MEPSRDRKESGNLFDVEDGDAMSNGSSGGGLGVKSGHSTPPLRHSGSAQFIVPLSSSEYPTKQQSQVRRTASMVVRSPAFDFVISALVCINFILICLDSDARADFPDRSGEVEPPVWVSRGMDFCFAVFAVELVVRIWLERAEYFRHQVNVADAVVVSVGAIEYILAFAGSQASAVGVIRVARLCRLARLMRVFRVVSGLGELRRLVQMMAGCFKTLLWSTLLLLLVMTIWSVIAVELINPYIQDMDAQGAWKDCDRCRRAFASTFMANLTLMQTVVAGDSWGLIAVPVIEKHPEVALIFIGSLMTLVFGVLNLIVAVIVDTFAENRLKDVNSVAKELDMEEATEKKRLTKIFEQIDVDGDGTLSYDEILRGARKVREFAQWLRVLDIDKQDLKELFKIVDEDNSGSIEPEEFVHAMYRMKHAEAKTTTKFVKHMVAKLGDKYEKTAYDLREQMRVFESIMSSRMQEQEYMLRRAIDSQDRYNSQGSFPSTVGKHGDASAALPSGASMGTLSSGPRSPPARRAASQKDCVEIVPEERGAEEPEYPYLTSTWEAASHDECYCGAGLAAGQPGPHGGPTRSPAAPIAGADLPPAAAPAAPAAPAGPHGVPTRRPVSPVGGDDSGGGGPLMGQLSLHGRPAAERPGRGRGVPARSPVEFLGGDATPPQ